MIKDLKKQFPIFRKYPDLVYLDNGATTLKPQSVIDATVDYYSQYSANIHRGVYKISEKATEKYEESRNKVARFINASEGREIVFTRGTTEAINLVARGWGDGAINAGDEIVVTQIEHHSNLVPWQQLAKRKNARLKHIDLSLGSMVLDWDEFKKKINNKTKVLAITHVSNVLGTINPIKEITAIVKKINPEVKVVVDGAQAVAHMKVDVQKLGCDFYAFSGHKMYGPTGVGVLWGKGELLEIMEPLAYGGGMVNEVCFEETSFAPAPEKFEGGTPPIAEVIALGTAIDFIEDIGYDHIFEQENSTYTYALEKLDAIEGVRLFTAGQGGIISFLVNGVHSHDVASILDRSGVCVRSGHHCAMPLHTLFEIDASTRMSLGIYNTKADIDKLAEGIKEVRKIFKK